MVGGSVRGGRVWLLWPWAPGSDCSLSGTFLIWELALMEDIQTACQDCWARDCGGRETAVRAGGGSCRAPLPRGREGAPWGRRGGRSSLLRGSHG